ncbi:hypothetical protein [Tessaracoccus sp. OH4464_COT-324]|uniref:hypothetical protein n=1 Tax=Tessaracoccus sp. OH4464_COT-324 TaxID=2491059 RepID=UPI000F6401AC|nr:hypothetical protein [Tessaracoccus sp. OH4464_COT-324]RRD45665.1 hypothetical protein EII42_10825 [Tessaracoccus sp. OH4464_COT-324]
MSRILILTLALVGLVAGCAQRDAPAGPGPVGTATQQWDYRSWQPTVEIVTEETTEEERQIYYRDRLAKRAQEGGLTEIPRVDMVRWTDSESHGEAMAECLTAAGFLAEPDGVGVRYPEGVPEAQATALSLADYVCFAKYPLDPLYAEEWSEAQLGLLYDYWDQYFIPCMAAHGLEIDRSKQPTREAYVSSFFTNRLDWWPSDVLLARSAEQRKKYADCPPYPPPEVFYGR